MRSRKTSPQGSMPAAAVCDCLIRGGSVIDGSGSAATAADVAIRGEQVCAVGELAQWQAGRVIDARGLVVAPGFIDAHTHDDRALLAEPDLTPKVSQGVTTVVTGNCGVSLAPLQGMTPVPPLNLLGNEAHFRFRSFADYLNALRSEPPSVNFLPLVGHTTLRVGCLSSYDRPAYRDELPAMEGRLVEALEAGAAGLSTGLFYPPASRADNSEVVALLRHVGSSGGIYTSHLRDEADGVVAALEEVFEAARAARVPLVISHHKICGARNAGRTRETLKLIRGAQRHQEIALDVYPYTAGSTMLEPTLAALADRVVITWSKSLPQYAGRDLDEIAAEFSCDRTEAVQRLSPGGAVYHLMSEEDVQRVLAFPTAMIGSDGLPHDRVPHPRLWGTFPRVLGHYARDLGLMSLEQAVYRMTALPARIFGLEGRGVISPNAAADIVIFDPKRVRERATYERPTEPCEGIVNVMVNGTVIWDWGVHTGSRPGRVLQRAATCQ